MAFLFTRTNSSSKSWNGPVVSVEFLLTVLNLHLRVLRADVGINYNIFSISSFHFGLENIIKVNK